VIEDIVHCLQVEALLDFRERTIQQVQRRYQNNQLIHDRRDTFTQNICCHLSSSCIACYDKLKNSDKNLSTCYRGITARALAGIVNIAGKRIGAHARVLMLY
jgi:hypothetical protein